ncbi:LOW QUALITY PROTEIN: uncharacterized protein LOC105433915 [Pogonomyrmex barbatus]|uniref:LOW QUALITY PROTEIN: uncharacterized protein LOC105433915 n=1 Tax=Pogonomyrmex barbatus TaxID=144034 RepID=A0A6I9XNR8_9HYME|nr:LOW QUALITY PROTEIN: uncharacterized protein LOC105433915 [Pogonomyrmex barbatus]
MRRASPGRGSRHRLFAGCAMMAECARTGCGVSSSSPSIEFTVESIAHRGGNIAERNRGSSTCLGRATDNKCQNGTTSARAVVDQTWGREAHSSNVGRCSRRTAGSRGCM